MNFLVLVIISLLLSFSNADRVVITDLLHLPPSVIQSLSKVEPLSFHQLTTYSFFTRVHSNTTLYSILTIPSSSDFSKLAIYLPGGPGISLFTALFEEIGPFMFSNDLIIINNNSLATEIPVLFIDQPYSTGLSESLVVNKSLEFSSKMIGELVNQIFKVFPQFQKSKLILGGSSFGLKFCLNFYYYNPEFDVMGFFSGNPIISCKHQNTFQNFLSNFGLLTKSDADFYTESSKILDKYLENNDYKSAGSLFLNMATYVSKNSVKISEHHIGKSKYSFENFKIMDTVNSMLDSLHASGSSLQSIINSKVRSLFAPDTCHDVSNLIDYYLSRDKVFLIYSGEFDLVCNSLGLINWITSLNRDFELVNHFDGEELISTAHKSKLMDFVVIKGAGHFAGKDQPRELKRVFFNRFK
ncbi:hypothetical protein RCL1_008797 [Eukaryota sp. TZLM3-RCL]